MRIIFCLVIINTICSCNNDSGAKKNNVQPLNEISSINDDSNIVGHWSLCAESGGGQMNQYNQCPTVIFNSDGSGAKISPSGLAEPFRWVLKNKIIQFYYTEVRSTTTFPDTNYVISLRRDSSGLEMQILQEKKDYSFYLYKEMY